MRPSPMRDTSAAHSPASPTGNATTGPIGLRFTETMRGYFSTEQPKITVSQVHADRPIGDDRHRHEALRLFS